jgi:putative drug exporter of the RND superfamily
MSSRSSERPSEAALARWARFAVRRRGRVVIAWLAFVVVLGVLSGTVGGAYVNSFDIPGAESQNAVDLLEERFPSQAGDSATIVVQTDAGVDDPAVKQRLTDLLTQASSLPEVTGVVSPYDNAAAISADRKIAYATVNYDKLANDVDAANAKQLLDLVDRTSAPGFRVEVGGPIAAQAEQANPFGVSAIVGVVAAIIILLIAFGSVIAMGLPVATALAGLLAGSLGITLVARFMDLNEFTPSFGVMIGLGVGIDYALFVVTRFREGLGTGLSVEDAVVRAIDTAGRAVAFAGTVVAIALLGLFAIGIPFVEALGLAAAIFVVLSVLVALTLLPALLGYVGRRIDRWRIPGLHVGQQGSRNTFWYRWSEQIQRRPWPYLLGSAALLIVLALPLLDLRLGFSDDGNQPTSLHTRRAYDLLVQGFGPGFNGPLIFAIENEGGIDPAQLQQLSDTVRQVPGVATVGPAAINQSGDAAVISVIPTTSPQDAKTSDLLTHLRDDVIPPAVAGTGTTIYVGGPTAAYVDIDTKIANRMPLFFAIVIGLSVLLLAAVFRSVVVPIKAALMNLLSIGATYGVLVAVFQWGWAKDLFGIAKTGPVESFLPMFLFAILFGLSMDYEVFLLSRIREDYLQTRKSGEAVAHGLSVTARVIAAAAAIMICVFLSFVLGDERVIKEFGLGLATAIFVDATIVRLVLVPATMELLGDWNWWFPRWLDRIVPRLNVEGSVAPAPVAVEVD